jgi:hypothetical protein
MDPLEISAAAVVAGWLELATAKIDEELGEGYATANPVLIGAFLGACAAQVRNDRLHDDIAASLDGIRSALTDLAQAIDRHE